MLQEISEIRLNQFLLGNIINSCRCSEFR
jgi:hypothetical protein